MLVSVMHLCWRNGVDFDRRVRIARGHFIDELEADDERVRQFIKDSAT